MCAAKDADAWAALGCTVEDASGNCIGSGCTAAGLVPLGATAAATGFLCFVSTCETDGGDFVVTSEGAQTYLSSERASERASE